ncbi:MAG TPA: magnesium and cobalt transport protein CorA [Burkholderiaceae bacterium]|nr:magnesium and cobalt transport protein CorA [Burkholderiaceae bacterium]
MLINCSVYRNGSKLAQIDVESISEYLAQPDCFVWVALSEPSDDELAMMQREFGLHELAVEDAQVGHERPKIEEYGDTVFCVLHTIEFDPTDRLLVGELDVFAAPNFVLSIRHHNRQGFTEVRRRAENEPHLLRDGAGFVLYALMDEVVDRYFPILEQLEGEFDAIEARIFEPGAERKANLHRLYELKRRITTVKHAVAPLLEAAGKLVHVRVPPVCAGSREYFRDVYDHLARVNGSLDNLRETISTATQVDLSMVMLDEAETTKRLAAWAAIFAVATTLVGIWGMNFENMPELRWGWGYPLSLAVIGLACGLLYRRFRRAGWL